MDGGTLASGVCSATPINSTGLLKTYRLRETTEGFGVFPTKDGGYLVTGDTIAGGGMAAPYPYIAKTDAKGNKSWSKDFSSQSNALGEMSSRHIGRLAVETTDGNIITAADVIDFVDEDSKEFYGDILITKLNKNGTQLWSVMLGDHSIDRPRQIWALPGGGVLIMARFMQTGYGSEVTDGVPRYSVFIKIDKNGKVQSSQKMTWEAIDMQRLADGGFIALANIAVAKAESAENVIGPEVTMGDLPTVIKLDSNLKVSWAKSLEMIPSEMNTPTMGAEGALIMGKTTIRMPGGDFRNIQPTPDGGFIAFGFGDLALYSGLMTGLPSMLTSFSTRPFITAKVDALGNYQWAKKITNKLVSGTGSNDFHVVKTADGNFVIMQDVLRNSAGVDLTRNTNLEVLQNASVSNIELIKTDADLNPLWVKKIDVERNLSGYAIQPTADKGVVVAGNILTTEMHEVMGEMVPYKEMALIKVDTNGEVSGCGSISDQAGTVALEDQSSLLIMQNMSVSRAEGLKLKINKKVKEKVSTAKTIVREVCQYQKNSVAPVCSSAMSGVSASAPASQSSALPVAKTWAAINFDNTKEVAVEGEKNKTVHEELLPILNQVYNNQVRMKDSMTGMWLAYVFPRPATRADVEAVQKKYEELGYKIDESEGGNLWVSKIGLTLHLEFSIQNSMAGKMEVMF